MATKSLRGETAESSRREVDRMKEAYEKPAMLTEEVDVGTLVATTPAGPVPELQPFFGLCPPCP
jgi:hypothetical protein